MKICSLAYLPPPTWAGCTETFRQNLAKFPPKHDLILYSDHEYPDTVRLRGSPEIVRNLGGNRNIFAVNNAVFLSGMRIAKSKGYSHALYLEVDCRVGKDGWDDIIFSETFNLGRPVLVAGTVAVYNPCSAGAEAARRWARLIAANVKRNIPIATYGYKGAAEKWPSCVFCNGALSVIDVAWAERLIGFEDSIANAVNSSPHDMALGVAAWKIFEEDCYELFGLLNCLFSSYGNVLTSQEERAAMLTRGEVVACHQIKDNWQPA
jgi:hypothetical protein